MNRLLLQSSPLGIPKSSIWVMVVKLSRKDEAGHLKMHGYKGM
ncbi:UNVERIFIED_CONTAM: hypothetical protein ORL81_27475 [Bacillus cereus]